VLHHEKFLPMKRIHRMMLLASTLLLLPSTANAATILGAGVPSCGTWLAARTGTDADARGWMSQWTLGYLSGVAALSHGDVLQDLDAEGIFYWLDTYCQSRPTQHFYQAVEAFTANLVPQR
jgi:hypothetical protein